MGKPGQNLSPQAKAPHTGKAPKPCRYAGRCGGCTMTGIPYEEQLEIKQKKAGELLGEFGRVLPIVGMEHPEHYRAKVHHVFGRDARGRTVAGCYRAGSHRVTDISDCLIEDLKSQEIIASVKELTGSFKIRIYDEDTGYGLLRHVLVRHGAGTGEYMVILVVSSPVLPGKNNFARELKRRHPEITTIVLNINDADTSMVLGKRSITIYGPGFIFDRLSGLKFRISPESFYQVNPIQTERLYRAAIESAQLTGSEHVLDAYCGTGTIGLCAAASAGRVTGVELNPSAVRDARTNARINGIDNAVFAVSDAAEYLASSGIRPDVIFMDPPRSGSTESFMKAAAQAGPQRIVYISCEPASLRRDLKYFLKLGYAADCIRPFDMFPFTEGIETVVSMSIK